MSDASKKISEFSKIYTFLGNDLSCCTDKSVFNFELNGALAIAFARISIGVVNNVGARYAKGFNKIWKALSASRDSTREHNKVAGR